MLIELANYILIFALAAIGLQTLLLMPTLWSKGSAIPIKLAFHGAIFSVSLICYAIFTLIYAFISRDFSLTIVFETFGTQTPIFALFPAILSSREGFFFTFICIYCLCCIFSFSKKNLPTYQERGKYLCSCGVLLFFLLLLLITSANPFDRVLNPPMEGMSLNSVKFGILFSLRVVSLLTGFGILITSYITSICMHSKGHAFWAPVLSLTEKAFLCLVFSCGLNLASKPEYTPETGFFGWMPSGTLELSVLFLILGQMICLFQIKKNNNFYPWYYATILAEIVLLCADFFACEYRLFTLNSSQLYFPNPIIATMGLLTIFSLISVISTMLLKQKPQEAAVEYNKENIYFGISIASTLSGGIITGIISFLPALFLLLPNLPLKQLPNIYHGILLVHVYVFIISFTLGLLSIHMKKNVLSKKTSYVYAGFCFVSLIFLIKYGLTRTCIPALIYGFFVIHLFSWKIPKSFKVCLKELKKLPSLTKGCTFFAIGLVFLTIGYGNFLNADISNVNVRIMVNGVFWIIVGTIFFGIRIKELRKQC
ncbi:MAG: hypothetical protein MJ247_06585 [Alphaproteobacteria bacterium]|nr:hypothetical protein [Alphaproteobacteria bacterium]